MKRIYCACLLVVLQLQLVANSRSASDDPTENDNPSKPLLLLLERRQREQQVMAAGDGWKWQSRAGDTTGFIQEGDAPLFDRASVEHRPSAEQIRQVQNSYERESERESRQMAMAMNSPNRQIFNAHSYRTSPPLADKREQPYPPVQRIDPSRAGADDYKVVCYLESWAIYRPEPATSSPVDVDPQGCTHVIYSFLGLDKTLLTVSVLDHDYDVIRGGFKSALQLKQRNPKMKVMIAIGGWAEGGKQYSQMVSTAATRKTFIDSVVKIMEKYKFDGFDLDWEYPGATDRDGRWADKNNFASLVEEMSAVFRPRKWLLSAAVPAAVFRINEGYDVPRLAKGLDFFNVMTYDMHGTWDNYADHHAPLKKRPFDTGATQNLHSDGALSAWISQGVPASKIIFGIPFYGRNFKLANINNNQPRAPIQGAGTVGPFTKEAGFVAYFEICTWLKEGGWKEMKDPAGSPYLVKGDQWIGYDTVPFVLEKMEYVKSRGLGGAMVWAVGLDDIRGVCGPKRPLLTAINRGLGRVPSVSPVVEETTAAAAVTEPSTTSSEAASTTVEPVPEPELPPPTTAPTQPPPTTPPIPTTSQSPPTSAPITQEPTTTTTTEAASPITQTVPTTTVPPVPTTSSAPSTTSTTTSAPVTQSPPAPTPAPPSPGAPFTCSSDGYFADPSSCGRFYRCHNSVAYRFDCPSGLYFDIRYSVCNWPFLVDCSSQNRIISTASNQGSVNMRQMNKKTNGAYKLVCYYSSWAWLRRNDAKFVPENVLSTDCTHVLYAYAGLDPKDLILKSNDRWTDFDNKHFARITALKQSNPDLKVLLAMGGWTDSNGDTYSRLVSDGSARSNFAVQAAKFVDKNGFDGLHLDWQYPVCWQADCSKGPASDKNNYVLLAQAVKQELGKKGFMLGINLAGYTSLADSAFDGASLAQQADFLSVPAYDFHGSWERVTGHTAPLNEVQTSMKYWTDRGIPAQKLILGIPYYGQSFTLAKAAASADQAAIGVRARGAGNPGVDTQQAGMLAYYEICSLVQDKMWTAVTNSAPYAYYANQWVGYDNVQSVRSKAELIVSQSYGGAMIWAIDMDDFNNLCCLEAFPLTRAIARTLGLRNDQQPTTTNCQRPNAPVTPPPITLTTGYDSGMSEKPSTAASVFVTSPTTPRPTRPSTTTTQSTTTTRTTTKRPATAATAATTLPTVSVTGPCQNGAYYPVAGDCSSFARCVDGVLQQSSCSPGLMWNVMETLCDWPQNVNCQSTGNSYPTTTAVPVTMTSTSRPVVVTTSSGRCNEGQYSQSGPDCAVYQWCINGRAVDQQCPSGLHWNSNAKVCDWPANANCPFGTGPTSAPTRPSSTVRPTTSAPTAGTKPPSPIVTTSKPKPPTSVGPPPTSQPSKPGQYKVICYYTNWSWYRPGEGKYGPSDVDVNLCTHVLYGFATLDPTQLTMRVFDSWSDTDEYGPKLYAKVTALKANGIKVLIALGGWNDSLGNKYSRLVNDPGARKRFIDNAIIFIEQYGFDGLDLDWEYPKCWQVDCDAGPASDKAGFSAWVSELRAAFNPRGWLLSAAVSPSKTVIDAAYDVPSISRDLDWIGVMTYDYHGHWDKKTGHVAPLYDHSEADVAYFNTNYTLNYYIRLGGDPSKIIMGLPLYGQSFTLVNPSNTGLNSPSSGVGEAGAYTRQGGFLAYYEICKQIQSGGWTVVQDAEGAMGPYAYKGNQWVSFDDAEMIRKKSELVNSMGIGGAMIWALDLDDFRNSCGCETYPLLKTINRVLRNYPASNQNCQIKNALISFDSPDNNIASYSKSCQENSYKSHETDCSTYYHCVFGQWNQYICPNGLFWNKDHCDWPYNTDCGDGTQTVVSAPAPVAPAPANPDWTWQPPTTTTTTTPSPFPQVTVPDTGYKVICYFTNWAGYRQGEGKFKPEDIDAAMCTHIIYGFATLDPSLLTMRVFDSWADTDEYGPSLYAKVTAFKAKGIKVLIALGGWNDSLGSKYSQMVNNPSARKTFVDNAILFIEKYGFDGLDLDWEYPKCWQVNCQAGPDSDKPAFTAWVKELSAAFQPRGWLLSAAVSPSKTVIDFGYEVAEISKYLDWIGVMTYDYFGNWDKETGHVAPLYDHSEVSNVFFNTNYTLNYWIELGASPNKIIMGLPMYGQSFTLEDPQVNGLNAKSKGPGEAGEFTRQGGFLAFYEICQRTKQGGWTEVQDPEGAMGPYAYKSNQWTSYDDVAIIRRKSELVKTMGIAGAMIWALDLDDFHGRCGCERYPLLRTINRVLRDYPVPDPNCKF